jgi:hypothetical protein
VISSQHFPALYSVSFTTLYELEQGFTFACLHKVLLATPINFIKLTSIPVGCLWVLFDLPSFLVLYIKVKVKVTIVQALRLYTGRTAHRGSRGIALLFHDHGTGRVWGASVTPRPLFTPGKDQAPIVQEAGWATGPVWTGVENLAPSGFDSRTVQSVASRYIDWVISARSTVNTYVVKIQLKLLELWWVYQHPKLCSQVTDTPTKHCYGMTDKNLITEYKSVQREFKIQQSPCRNSDCSTVVIRPWSMKREWTSSDVDDRYNIYYRQMEKFESCEYSHVVSARPRGKVTFEKR